MGFRHARPVQAAAIGPALSGCDVLGLAPTGTGKTAAFIIPIAHHLIVSPPPKHPRRPVDPAARLRALVLCPTRELAIQVGEEAARLCAGSVLRVGCAYGKVAVTPQAQMVAAGIDLLVGTPGRVRELLDRGDLSVAFIRHLVIDEADRMLDLGFLPQVRALLESVPEDRQTMLFSATMPREVRELAEHFLRAPATVEIEGHTTPAAHIRQHLASVADRDKMPLLLHLVQEKLGKGVLVFCRTRRRVGWVGTALQRHGVACGTIHGDRTQAQRMRTLERFANGDLHVVVASDVAARGLHIPSVRTVVNYDLPNDPEEYVHRVGRAGHGGGRGASYTFLAPAERVKWDRICRAIGVSLEVEEVAGFEPPAPPRQRKTAGKKPPAKAEASRGRRSAESRRKRNRRRTAGERQPRSRKSRPVPKSEKPGRGVRRPPDAE